MNNTIEQLSLFFQTSVQVGTPILLGTLGGIINEKSGHLNLGIEGMMLMGAAAGFSAACAWGNPLLALLMAGLAGALGALLYAIITVTLKGNHVVTGLALTIFGTGIANFYGKELSSQFLPASVIEPLSAKPIPLLKDIPFFGNMLFNQSIMVYLSLLLAVILFIFYKKTSAGINARAVGENPAAADASGVKVDVYKYLSILSSGFLCGLAGAYLSLVFLKSWQDNITAGIGWIAVALIIFATWNPLKAIYGAYLFGLLRGLGLQLQNMNISLFGHSVNFSTQILSMLPYVMTIVVLVVIGIRKRKENQPPAWLGNAYFREDR